MTAKHHEAVGTGPNDEVSCNAFSSNIFKPDYCSHCFKARTAHAKAAMPLQNNMPNGHHRLSKNSHHGSNGLPNSADVWVRKENGGADYRHPRFGEGPHRNDQSFSTNRSCQSTKEQSTQSEKRGSRAKSAVENGVGNKRIGSTNGDAYHSHESNPNVYEAIYPTNETIESFDNQANSLLETSHMKQRSYSDVRSPHCLQNKDMCRRVSSPSPGTEIKNKFIQGKRPNSNMYEFQKLAGHLNHTNRKEAVSEDSKSAVPQSHLKKKIPSRCGYSQVNKIGAGTKNTDKKPIPHGRNFTENNASADFRVRAGGDNKKNNRTDSPSSSCSKASDSNEEVAPVVPVRSDSMRKKTSEEPGFALECLVPDRITIISADGSKEVVTSGGHSHTTAPPAGAESNTELIAKQTNRTKIAVRSKSSPQITLPKEPTSTSVVPNPPSEPPLEAIPYEIMTVGPLRQNSDIIESNQMTTGSFSECPQKEETNSTQENLLPSLQEKSAGHVIPPFPLILHNDQDHKAKNRHSGNYKVPIFIKHQDYDNFGTVLADQDYEAMQLKKQTDNKADVSPMSDATNVLAEDQYYLKPTEMEEPKPNGNASSQERLITEDEYEVVGQAKAHAEQPPNEQNTEANVSQKEVKIIPTKPPRRSRSQTHPLICHEGQLANGESSSSQSTPETRSRVKRTAPRPPVLSKEDTMPRMPPPPPPTDKARRLSKDLQEGIIRYHCSASPATNIPKSKSHSSAATKASPICQKKLVNSEAKLSPALVSPGRATDTKLVTVKESDELEANDSSTPRGNKEKAKPNLVVSPGKGRSAPKPMISPPKTHLLHYLGESPPSSTGHESRQKEKKSLMFWKKRRRKGSEGSPEREYNTDFVTQWLEKLGYSPPMAQRHSWERMEVINAYKGQETAIIGYKGQQDTNALNNNSEACSAKRKAPKPPREATASSDSSSQLSPETTDQKLLCKDAVKEQKRRNSESVISSSGNGHDGQDLADSHLNAPPRTRSQRRRRSYTVHEVPEYVNIAFMKQNKTPPTKPHRRVRGSRSLTTGFENLPSVTKRLAPKNPEEDAESKMNAARSSASDQGSLPKCAKNSADPQTPQTPTDSQTRLKSALKKMSMEGEIDQFISTDKPPRRPVRLIQADGEVLESDNQYGLPQSGYVNLEVKQVDPFKGLDGQEPGRLASAASSMCPDVDIILAQVQSMQCETLAQAGELYPRPSLKKSMFQDKTWDDFIIHERTVLFSDEKTFSFRAELKESHQEVCLMVFLHEHMLDQIFAASSELESFPHHPNMLDIIHTFKMTLPAYLFDNTRDSASQSNCRDSPCSQSDVVVVVTSQLPTSTASLFLQESPSAESREEYEESVWIMVLQVCRGVAHAQKHEPDLSLEGLKQESVLRAGAVSGLWLFNPLVVSTLAVASTGRRDSVVSHLTDKCCEFDLGILIYELLGQPNPFTVRTSLMSRNYTPDELPSIPALTPYSSKLTTLARECLRRCPEERINMAQALWIVNALTFCPNLVLEMDGGDGLDVPRLNHLIMVKQTELVCSLAAQRSISREFTLWEKLELLFWCEVNGIKLEQALQTLRG